MKNKQGILALVALLALSLSGSVFAKTVYIHDVLRVDLRAGPTNGYKIINFLKTGTAMEVLQTSQNGKWTQVKYRSQTGWIQSQYLTDKPVASLLLKRANEKLAKIEQQNRTLTAQLATTQKELKELKSLRSQLDSSNNTLQTELENLQRTARNAINTERYYRELQESTELLKVELENLKTENTILSDDNLKEGIKWGIIAVIVGALMAVMIPKMSGRKRRSEW